MERDHPHAFDPSRVVEISQRNLPHWRQEGVVYFVTFRLADSLPAEKLSAWRQEREQWLRLNPPPHTPEQHRQEVVLWDERINRWLDAGHGSCLLAQSRPGQIVEDALRHFDAERYLLGDYVVMPNHVHALVLPTGRFALSDLLHSWKSYTAHQINKLLDSAGQVWQDESFDHIVRDQAAWRRFGRYIAENPSRIRSGSARLGCGKLGPADPPM